MHGVLCETCLAQTCCAPQPAQSGTACMPTPTHRPSYTRPQAQLRMHVLLNSSGTLLNAQRVLVNVAWSPHVHSDAQSVSTS